MDASEILKGPDYFTCELLHIRMQKIHCVERQKAKGKKGEFRYPVCQGCEKGAQIRKEMRMKAQEGPQKCKTDGCTNPAVARGLCRSCYDKRRRRDLSGETGFVPEGETRVTLDFARFPDMFAEIKKQAGEQLRSLESQVLWLVKGGLEANQNDS